MNGYSMRTAVTVLLTAMIAGATAAQPVDRQKLRQAAQLPPMPLPIRFGLEFSPASGFQLSWERFDVPKETAALQKAIQGDANDAERYHRLGQLFRERNDARRARAAFSMAVSLYRQRLKARPRSGSLQAQLGEALIDAGREEEAETVLRRAVKIAPREWRGWTARGRWLSRRSLASLLGASAPMKDWLIDQALRADPDASAKVVAQLLRDRPSPEQLARAQRLLGEASTFYDKAVAAAPQQPEPYIRRRTFQAVGRIVVEGSLRASRDGRASLEETLHRQGENLVLAMMAPEAVSDFQRAARLSPQNYRLIATAALSEIFSFAYHSGLAPSFTGGELWNALPEKIR